MTSHVKCFALIEFFISCMLVTFFESKSVAINCPYTQKRSIYKY